MAGNQPRSQGLGLPVDFFASSAQWGVEKPSPRFFQKIVEELSLPPSLIAYVGDRLDNDILPAVEAGMTAVFVRRGPWGTIHARRPEIAKTHLCVETLGELPEALGAIRRFPDAVRRIPKGQ
jgi:FMN phosphatase YigB (HAD superfamily)